MRKANVILITIIALFISCDQTSKKYVINGTIADKQEGMVYLKYFKNKMFFNFDSTQINNGKFTFKGKIDKPLLFALTTEDMPFPMQFFLENRTIDINIQNNELEIFNSPSNELFQRLSQQIYRNELDIDSLITKHPDSNVAAFYLYRYFTYQLSLIELKNIRKKISLSLNDSPYIQELDDIIGKLEDVQIGHEALDFVLNNPDDISTSLKDFKGKYILLNFWASWCSYCREDNPIVKNIYNEYENSNLEMIGISLDYNKNSWLEEIKKGELDWVQLSDLKHWDSYVSVLYGIRSIPSYILISPEGTIIEREITAKRIYSKIKKYYADEIN